MGQKLTDAIKQKEHQLAIYKAVLNQFPDASIRSYGFVSKMVNSAYTDLSFEKLYGAIYVCPTYKMVLNIGDEEEIIDIHSSPKVSRLAYIGWHHERKKRVIKFSRLAVNLKNNNFKDDMMNSCRAKIMEFIKEHPKNPLDTKHLEPRLKKLLVFT